MNKPNNQKKHGLLPEDIGLGFCRIKNHTMKIFCTHLVLLSLLAAASSEAALDSGWDSRVASFPAPAVNMQRATLDLYKTCNSKKQIYKMEIVVGKEIIADSVNQYKLVGELKTKVLDGIGYKYYEVPKISLVGEKIHIQNDAEKVKRYVTSAPFSIDCNNNDAPVVIYVPQGYDVQSRVWVSEKEFVLFPSSKMLQPPTWRSK